MAPASGIMAKKAENISIGAKYGEAKGGSEGNLKSWRKSEEMAKRHHQRNQ
jgi:hypothetical protein